MAIKIVGKADPAIFTAVCKDVEGGCNSILEFEYKDVGESQYDDGPTLVFIRCCGCNNVIRLGSGGKEKVLPKYLKAQPSLDRT